MQLYFTSRNETTPELILKTAIANQVAFIIWATFMWSLDRMFMNTTVVLTIHLFSAEVSNLSARSLSVPCCVHCSIRFRQPSFEDYSSTLHCFPHSHPRRYDGHEKQGIAVICIWPSRISGAWLEYGCPEGSVLHFGSTFRLLICFVDIIIELTGTYLMLEVFSLSFKHTICRQSRSQYHIYTARLTS